MLNKQTIHFIEKEGSAHTENSAFHDFPFVMCAFSYSLWFSTFPALLFRRM